MFVQKFGDVRFISKSAKIQMPRRRNLILDPRASIPYDVRFDCQYHDDGIVTLTTDHERYDCDGECSIWMRVYDPANETIPDFDSTIYTYLGRDEEHAPADTTIGIIDPLVKTIKKEAFNLCKKMKKCIMYGGVETIQSWAFCKCASLEAIFLPSSIKIIERDAFWRCKNIRILSIPTDIDISPVVRPIRGHCNILFQITQIPRYSFEYSRTNNDQVNQGIIDLYRNLPPLHRACLDVNVSVQTIHDCIVTHGTQAVSITDHEGMTPLHILAMNPHATVWHIKECFDADTSVALLGDNRGNTPLDYLKENNLAGHTLVVASLCVHRDAYSSSTSNNDGDKASTVHQQNKNKRKRGE